ALGIPAVSGFADPGGMTLNFQGKDHFPPRIEEVIQVVLNNGVQVEHLAMLSRDGGLGCFDNLIDVPQFAAVQSSQPDSPIQVIKSVYLVKIPCQSILIAGF